MKFINRFIDLLLYSSLFAAGCATGLCMATERLIENSVPPVITNLHLLVFGSSLVVYNAPRILVRQGIRKGMKLSRSLYFLFFAMGWAMMIPAIWWLPARVIVLSVILGGFSFAYSIPILPFKNKKRLREFGFLKIFVLTGVWTIATSILPIVYLGKSIVDYPIEIMLRFTFMFALCVAFDIRDMTIDRQNNINTLPHKVGVQNSYHLINTSLLLFVLLSVFQFARYQHAERLAGALLTAVITWAVIIYLKKHPSNRGYLLYVDGAMLLYSVLVLLH